MSLVCSRLGPFYTDWRITNVSPVKILRSFPPLQAVKIKFLAISLVPRIPDDVYDEIVRHAK